MKKRMIYALIIFLPVGLMSSMEETPQPYVLNVALMLDVGTESDSIGATSQAILAAIRDKVPFIASSRLISNILRNLDTSDRKEEYEKLFIEDFLNKSTWALFANEMNDFVIALPKGFWPGLDSTNFENFPLIGLNQVGLKAIPMDLEPFKDLFKDVIKPAHINIDSLKNLFANPQVRKRIYLIGHGSADRYLYKDKGKTRGLIAGLSIDRYKEFLTFLNKVGADLLYVNSCFVGGIHSLTPYVKTVDDVSKEPNIDYFLIIGGITDTFVYNGYNSTNFECFFKELNEFFSPKGVWGENPFRSFVTCVWPKESTRNIPSVRLPGSDHYFKVINIDQAMQVINQAMVTAHVLKEKGLKPVSLEIAQLSEHIKEIKEKGDDASSLGYQLEKKLFELKEQEHHSEPIIIPGNKNFVILYPSMVPVPLVMTDRYKMLPFLSMIPGNAFHYIQEIDADKSNIDDALLEAFYHYRIESTKAFFIKNIFAFNKTINHSYQIGIPYETGKKVNFENVFITGDKTGGFVILKVDGTYYQAHFKYSDGDDENPFFVGLHVFNAISQEKAEQIIVDEMRIFPMLPETVEFLGGKKHLKQQVNKIMKILIPNRIVDVSNFNFLK